MPILPSHIAPMQSAERARETAFRLGKEDAETGAPQVPEQFFVKGTANYAEYNRGYASVIKHRQQPEAIQKALEPTKDNPFAGAFQGDYRDIEPMENRPDWIGM